MWRVKLGVVGLSLLILVGMGAADRAATVRAAAGKPKSRPTKQEYVPVTSEEVQQHAAAFVGKRLRIPDRFLEWMTRFPKGVRRRGFTPETHIGFRTHAVVGSNMMCFLPRSDKRSAEELKTALKETQILLYGKLVAHAGRDTLFAVDRAIRGWQVPVETEVRLVLTLEWQGGKKTWRDLKPGQRYRVKSPYAKKPLWITINQ